MLSRKGLSLSWSLSTLSVVLIQSVDYGSPPSVSSWTGASTAQSNTAFPGGTFVSKSVMARLCLCIIYVFTACILHHAYYYTRSSFFKFHNMRVYPKLPLIYTRSHNVLLSRLSQARFNNSTVSQDFTVHIRVRSKSSWCYLGYLNMFYTECNLRITITADIFETWKNAE